MIGLLTVLFMARIQPVLVIVETGPIVGLPFGGDWIAYYYSGQYNFTFYDDAKSVFYATPTNSTPTRSTDGNTITFNGWGLWVAPNGAQSNFYYSYALTRHVGTMPTFVWRLRPYTPPGVPLLPLTTNVSGTISVVKSLQW